jgi:exodeoxyribonuclease VII large subunit
MGRALETLSPLAILERGYALVFNSSGNLIKDAGQVMVGEEITARMARGEIRATVKKKREDKPI